MITEAVSSVFFILCRIRDCVAERQKDISQPRRGWKMRWRVFRPGGTKETCERGVIIPSSLRRVLRYSEQVPVSIEQSLEKESMTRSTNELVFIVVAKKLKNSAAALAFDRFEQFCNQ